MNEHIKDYCEKFIESRENPHYAVFLNGKWGTGKTYFINKLLEKYTDKTEVKKKDIIKISLFGVKSTEEIDLKIYQAIHPLLSSKGMKLAGAILRSAIKLGTTVDINGDGKDDISISSNWLDEIKSKGKVDSVSKRLIVVDDLERIDSSFSPNQVFAYFSEIITESDIRVIFVGNEEKIADKSENEKNDYLKIKEKTIGIEFTIEPNKNEAISSFISELSLTKTDFYVQKLSYIMNVLKCDNLRTVWQALYNLNLFAKILDDVIEEEDKEEIFEIFLVLYIQKNLEEIHKTDDVESVLSGYFVYHKPYKEHVKWLEEKKKDQKYFFPDTLMHVLLRNVWKKLIFEGCYDKNWIADEYTKELEERKRQNKNQKNLFKLANNWRNLNKNEFESLFKTVVEEFENGSYLNAGEIVFFCYFMFLYSNWKIIPNSISDIVAKFHKLVEKKKSQIEPLNYWNSHEFIYNGYGLNLDDSEYKKLFDEMAFINKNNLLKQSQDSINKDLELLKKDVVEFCRNILHCDGTSKYYEFPILSFINVDEFYNILQNLSIGHQRLVEESFEERYGKRYSNGTVLPEYADDYQNLKKIAEKYNADNANFLYNPLAYEKKRIGEKWTDLVKYFEEQLHLKDDGINEDHKESV
ncbi:MAG: AAA family ATPase [Fibrobacter sp.]|nr:AAA family ATPase [Fibrobacter sp.]